MQWKNHQIGKKLWRLIIFCADRGWKNDLSDITAEIWIAIPSEHAASCLLKKKRLYSVMSSLFIYPGKIKVPVCKVICLRKFTTALFVNGKT